MTDRQHSAMLAIINNPHKSNKEIACMIGENRDLVCRCRVKLNIPEHGKPSNYVG